MKIIWSKIAINQIKILKKYISFKTISDLRNRTKVLKDYPFIGQKETFLNARTEEFRYLLEGNYKIIYWVDKDIIRIYSIFDTRQNPEKLKNLE